jgi:beta-lactamase class A
VLPAALIALALLPAADPTGLEAKLKPLADAHQGKIAVAVKHLGTGDEFYLNADEPMPTASLIKLAVMVETFWQAEEGKVKLDGMLMLRKADMVPGAGVLTDSFSPGSTLALRDAVRLMITVSDNTATNLVLDEIGIPSTAKRMAALGLPETRINAKVYRGSTTSVDKARTDKYGLGSTTARETVRLLELIHAGKVVTPRACEEMLGILRKNQDNEMLVRKLPSGTSVAHKTGAVSAARTDAGIITLPAKKGGKPEAVAICVLTNENKDQRWVVDNAAQLVIADIGRAVYDHFAAAK